MVRVCTDYASVELVVVFGSVVRGQARPDSDVDVGVLGGGFWGQLGIATDVGRRLDKESHVVDLASLHYSRRLRLRREYGNRLSPAR